MKTDLESRKKETKHFLWTFIFLPTVLTFAATFLMGAVGFIFLVFIGWGGAACFFLHLFTGKWWRIDCIGYNCRSIHL